MDIIKIDETQIVDAIDLIWTTFLQFDAPDYSEEGIQSFKDFIESKEIISTLEFWGAYDGPKLKGVIATNENRKHICCFFVKAEYHRQRIGRRLWEYREAILGLSRLDCPSAKTGGTVNGGAFMRRR